MERYKFTKIESDKKTKSLYYKSTYYPNIPISDSDIFIVTKYGDRLEETEDDFLEIVDDVEEIMSHYFTKD